MGLSDGRQTKEGGETGERPRCSKGQSRRGACYLPTWGFRRRRLSVGLEVACRRVTGWLRA